jgi:hypothetical protein
MLRPVPMFRVARPALTGFFLALWGLGLNPAAALVEKTMKNCGGQQICPVFRASFDIPEGWHEDQKTGNRLGVRIFLPDGETFESAPAIIYALARQRNEGEDITASVSQHHETWRRKAPEVTITFLEEVRRTDGSSFRLHQFVSKASPQPYERVATGFDKDMEGNVFVIRLVLTAKSEEAMRRTEDIFRAMLMRY